MGLGLGGLSEEWDLDWEDYNYELEPGGGGRMQAENTAHILFCRLYTMLYSRFQNFFEMGSRCDIHAIEHIYYVAIYHAAPCYIADFQNFLQVGSRCDIACYITCYIATCYIVCYITCYVQAGLLDPPDSDADTASLFRLYTMLYSRANRRSVQHVYSVPHWLPSSSQEAQGTRPGVLQHF